MKALSEGTFNEVKKVMKKTPTLKREYFVKKYNLSLSTISRIRMADSFEEYRTRNKRNKIEKKTIWQKFIEIFN